MVTLNGRDIYLGPHGTETSKREYDRQVSEWLAAGRSTPEADEGITVVELVARYLAWGKTHYRKNGKLTETWLTLTAALRELRRLYGRTPAREFGPRRMDALLLKLQEKRDPATDPKVRVERLSRSTINAYAATIRRMFRWAAAKELVPPSVPQALAMVAGLQKGRTKAPEGKPVLPVDDATVNATVERLPQVVADMVRLQRLTGMRPAEVCLVRPADVDTSGDVWLYRPESHKTEHHGHHRTIAIGPQGQDVLRPYLLRPAEAYCFDPRDSERKRRHQRTAARVTAWNAGNTPGSNKQRTPKRKPGERYTPDSYRRAVQRAAELASVKAWSPNQLRHTAATEIRARFGLEAAQVTLGHTRADITQVYAERDLSKAIEVARKIG